MPEGPDGRVSKAALEAALHAHAHHPLVIGSFSAGSNVTGALAAGGRRPQLAAPLLHTRVGHCAAPRRPGSAPGWLLPLQVVSTAPHLPTPTYQA
jgi:hypothetical protein